MLKMESCYFILMFCLAFRLFELEFCQKLLRYCWHPSLVNWDWRWCRTNGVRMLQMVIQRGGIYVCCEMLKKLHSVGFFATCACWCFRIVNSCRLFFGKNYLY